MWTPFGLRYMNSVMDDNKLLTLANGERIRLQPHCALLFEVGDLQYASPATVSRAGMVYVDPKNLGYDPFWERWLSERPSREEREELGALYQRYVPGSVLLIKEGVVGVVQQDPLKYHHPTDGSQHGEPFHVTELCYEGFYDIKALASSIGLLNMMALKLSQMEVLKLASKSSTSISYKMLYCEDFKEATIIKRKNKGDGTSVMLSTAFFTRPGLSQKKIF
ncbi:unnamed protein product [Timema podura]|uniref:Uncharacterized protein n=1 Tax=Timema podura TaxID=61482 RepID=A0ABN7NT98_TIMPD|nr:unnamed protein product [Timema podura]